MATHSTLIDALTAACSDLRSLDAQFAIVGGLAVSARAEPRLTRDLDVAVSVDTDAGAEDLIRRLTARRYRVASLVEQTKTGRLATARLLGPANRVIVDLLFASCGIEREIVAEAEELEIVPGLRARVATTAHLIAMKLLAMDARSRPQDADDIRALLAIAKAADRRRVSAAITAIENRGYSRGRDLQRIWKKAQRG